MYIRFTTGKIHDRTLYEEGVFHAAYQLKKQGALPNYEQSRLGELLEWFNLNLLNPIGSRNRNHRSTEKKTE